MERTGRDVRIDLGGVGEEWQVYMIKTRYIYIKFSMVKNILNINKIAK